MLGQQLSLDEVKGLLEDAREAGVETVRLYGGEPLLHPDLPQMVRHAVDLGLSTYVTTNGVLLRQRIDALFEAGLRDLTIGFYGTGEEYDAYTQRPGRFARLEEGLNYARSRYGSALSLQLNYLIMRPSCRLEALQAAWDFAERFSMTFHTDLLHYSLPYFTDGIEADLHFRPADSAALGELVTELVRLKQSYPGRICESLASINSIPDWLLRGLACACRVTRGSSSGRVPTALCSYATSRSNSVISASGRCGRCCSRPLIAKQQGTHSGSTARIATASGTSEF